AISDAGFEGSSEVVNVTVGSGCPQAPYLGYLHSVPGKIEAEDYDLGGSNEAFSDSDAGNTGGQYRNEDVDIEVCSDNGGGYDVGWISSGEWMEYSVDVKKSSNYDFQFRVASTFTMGKINVYVDDQLVASNIQVSSTGDWQNWDDIFAENIPLTEGRHTVKLEFAAGLFNLNYFRIYESGTSPSITLISPNGGETYGSNSVQEIIWEADRVDNVKIGLSTNGGTSWSFVSQGTQAKLKSHRWIVPEANSDNCMIMILDAQNLSISDVNDAPFSITTSVSVKEDDNLLNEFKLEQNFPNPFNPTTVIRYSLPDEKTSSENSALNVSLVVYDLFGREVAVLVKGKQSSGIHEVRFNGEGLASGIYVYKLSYNGKTLSKKMLLLK
ncbi:MAG: carbohydrate-binding protein, partial [Ignavibacteria bacterium]